MHASHSRRLTRHTGGETACRSVRNLAVCVVDPRVEDYAGFNELAQASGLRLTFVATAAEALRLARTQRIDLWVVNADLPGLSGCELCSLLKERAPATPVYVVADEYSASVERQAWAHRATLFCVKPDHRSWLTMWNSGRLWCSATSASN